MISRFRGAAVTRSRDFDTPGRSDSRFRDCDRPMFPIFWGVGGFEVSTPRPKVSIFRVQAFRDFGGSAVSRYRVFGAFGISTQAWPGARDSRALRFRDVEIRAARCLATSRIRDSADLRFRDFEVSFSYASGFLISIFYGIVLPRFRYFDISRSLCIGPPVHRAYETPWIRYIEIPRFRRRWVVGVARSHDPELPMLSGLDPPPP